jgi:putative transcriptional regulator
MKVYQHIVKINEQEIKMGDVIIAQSFWDDEDLQRSVIIILQHDDKGSAGIIINRQSNLKIKDVIPDLNVNLDLFYGGPNGINKIGFLHSIDSLSQSFQVCEGLYWGGNIYQLQHLFHHEKLDPEQVRFYAGLIEWQPGQLNEEIAENKWWVSDITFQELLITDINELWQSKLIKEGNLYGLLHDIPDPSLN